MRLRSFRPGLPFVLVAAVALPGAVPLAFAKKPRSGCGYLWHPRPNPVGLFRECPPDTPRFSLREAPG